MSPRRPVGGWHDAPVAEFLFFTGPMDCGKSTLALQFDYTQAASGRRGRLFTSQDRAGDPPCPPAWGGAPGHRSHRQTSTSGSSWWRI